MTVEDRISQQLGLLMMRNSILEDQVQKLTQELNALKEEKKDK